MDNDDQHLPLTQGYIVWGDNRSHTSSPSVESMASTQPQSFDDDAGIVRTRKRSRPTTVAGLFDIAADTQDSTQQVESLLLDKERDEETKDYDDTQNLQQGEKPLLSDSKLPANVTHQAESVNYNNTSSPVTDSISIGQISEIAKMHEANSTDIPMKPLNNITGGIKEEYINDRDSNMEQITSNSSSMLNETTRICSAGSANTVVAHNLKQSEQQPTVTSSVATTSPVKSSKSNIASVKNIYSPQKRSNARPVSAPQPYTASHIAQARQEARPSSASAVDDEFGDFDFNPDTLANIDALVTMATQQPAAADNDSTPGMQSDEVKSIYQKAGNNNDNDEFEDDPFAEFVIDIEAIDKSIAIAQTQNAQLQQQQRQVVNDIVNNPKVVPLPDTATLQRLTFSRYKVVSVHDNTHTYCKILSVVVWDETMLDDIPWSKAVHRSEQLERFLKQQELEQSKCRNANGDIHLRGEWYHTPVQGGDIVHICSLNGHYRTDSDALPLILHTHPPTGSDTDDLLFVIHPDMLLTPSIISETVACTRRAVLKQRIGSTGLTEKAPLYGTIRHQLFEDVMKNQTFDEKSIKKYLIRIIRDNAENILAAGTSSKETYREVSRFVPQIISFANTYTQFGPAGHRKDVYNFPYIQSDRHATSTRMVASKIYSVEEMVVCPELGLNGYVDSIMNTVTALPDNTASLSLTGVELKTNQSQKTQNAHLAQLTLYIAMLRSKFGTSTPRCKVLGSTDAGLLLYLNGESTRVVYVDATVNEIKSLINQRNILAVETDRASQPRGVTIFDVEDGVNHRKGAVINSFVPAKLPDLLHSVSTCERCFVKAECMTYAKVELEANGMEDVRIPHSELIDKYTSRLTSHELRYFRKWEQLLDLEINATHSVLATSWLQSATEREMKDGKCLSAMKFKSMYAPEVQDDNNNATVILIFAKDETTSSQPRIDISSFEKGSHVVLSTDCRSIDRVNVKQMYILKGLVENATRSSISIRVSQTDHQRLVRYIESQRRRDANPYFRFDKNLGSVGSGTLRQNMLKLIRAEVVDSEDTLAVVMSKRCAKLRKIIIDLSQPRYNDELSFHNMFPFELPGEALIPGCDPAELFAEYSHLNVDQKAAVDKVLSHEDFVLVQGLPGTGKTSTLIFIVRLLAAMQKRILITSYTHAAVDNIFLKLIDKGLAQLPNGKQFPAIARVGTSASCHRGVQNTLVSEIARKYEQNKERGSPMEYSVPAAESLAVVMTNAQIVGVTALSIPRSPLLLPMHFDVVIVDEAGQISQPAILGALMAADTFVLVGDHMQLPPLVNSELADDGGYGVSLMKHLADAHSNAVVPLTLQYRMNEDICQLSNDLVYKGNLKCANQFVSDQRLMLNNFTDYTTSLDDKSWWLKRIVDPQTTVVFANTDSLRNGEYFEDTTSGQKGSHIINAVEAKLVSRIVSGLIGCGLKASDIGVITPFRAQIQKLCYYDEINFYASDGLEISTIDRYQGRDKSVVIVSFVRGNSEGRVGRLLEDFRRLNVALTRAKCKLVMVGSFSTLYAGSNALKPVLQRVKMNKCLYNLPREAMPTQTELLKSSQYYTSESIDI